ncbi:ABC transporter permease [Deminuibacter soli]|uniref:Transport permease protein n=1 Tax=Deminuibacter soli TaxID=2291815 RepID=A0A3E1NES2_9BACT|nr:ABC transporter permease [Deminuibacter soli]RFM26301.1 ABC transporter permease [Deminuibacter soli]
MKGNYSQLRAMLAITKGSVRSIFRSPSAVFFSLGFPLVFILVFGFLGKGGGVSLDIAFARQTDTTNEIYQKIKYQSGFRVKEASGEIIREDLEKGRLTAVLNIQKGGAAHAAYTVHLTTSEAVNPRNIQILQSILKGIVEELDQQRFPDAPTVAQIDAHVQQIPGRVYRSIDFILPGQLGFSLLSASIFGVAFLFFNLRQQLVLKRFFATPITRPYIIMGEALSRVLFQLLTAVIIVGIGTLFFHFTLVNGFITFIEIMLLSFIALIVFMGGGFIVSSVAKNESVIPLFANILTLPQFLLAGTFFPIESFPGWLQPLCRALPLTHFNIAMRNIAFEGASLVSCWQNIGVLLIWGVVVYGVAIKVFKWE